MRVFGITYEGMDEQCCYFLREKQSFAKCGNSVGSVLFDYLHTTNIDVKRFTSLRAILVLKTKSISFFLCSVLFRFGVPQLYRHRWAIDHRLKKNKSSSSPGTVQGHYFPKLVSTIMTDGLQAKIGRSTLVSKRTHAESGVPDDDVPTDDAPAGPLVPQSPLPLPQLMYMAPDSDDEYSESVDSFQVIEASAAIALVHLRDKGVDSLALKVYSSIKGKLHISQNFTGIFESVDKGLPGPTNFYLVGVDPGQMVIATYVAENIGDRPENLIFKDARSQHWAHGTYSDEEYRTKAMFDDEKAFERASREDNIAYRDAIDGFSTHTLKRLGHASAYVDYALTTIEARMSQLMSPTRRHRTFLRFRKRQHTYADITNRIVFGDVYERV